MIYFSYTSVYFCSACGYLTGANMRNYSELISPALDSLKTVR